jgi:hypothetical protein
VDEIEQILSHTLKVFNRYYPDSNSQGVKSMSLAETLKAGFKNFGHAIAVAAKYTVVGLKDAITFANKAEQIAPEAEQLIGALAGPQAEAFADLAFHALGDIAQAIEKLPAELDAATAAQGLNLSLDEQFIQDVRAALPALKKIISALGAEIPKV